MFWSTSAKEPLAWIGKKMLNSLADIEWKSPTKIAKIDAKDIVEYSSSTF